MADQSPTYLEQVFAAVRSPDAWDAGGTIFASTEQAFKEFGELVGRLRTGALSTADAQRLDAAARYMANGVSRLSASVAAIDVSALTPEDQKLKAFFSRFAQQGQRLVQETGLVLDEVAAGTASAAQRLTASTTSLLKLGGTYLAVLQVAMAFAFDGQDEAGKKAAGALGGIAGTAVGAAAGGGFGSLIATGASMVGVTVSTALAASVGAVLGAAAVSFVAGKALEEAYAPYIRPILAEMFDAGGAAFQRAETFYRDSLARLGEFDGTWLEGLDATAEQKAALTTLLAGISRLPASDAMNADIRRLFEAPFEGNTLVSRDDLLRTVMRIAQEQNAYVSERISVAAGSVTLRLPPGSSAAVELRSLIERTLDPDDRRGLSLTGANTVVLSPGGGTLAGGAQRDLLIGSSTVDGLIGGAGSDELVAGAGDDILLGEAGADVLFGGTGADLLDGGDNGDYLYGGQGDDTYRFTGAFGSDWVVDSDGQGHVEVDGQVISGSGTRRVGDNVYEDDDWIYTLVPNGQGGHDLVLQRDSSLNTIRIRDWSAQRNLGITLNDTPAQPPAPAGTFTGDIVKALDTDGITYRRDGLGNYLSDGAQPGTADVLNGDGGGNLIQGLDGNDGLAGQGGDDRIEGGAGDDLILGGTGRDVLSGGAGNDFIFGSGVGRVDAPRSSTFTPPVAQGPERARGFSWVAYENPAPGPDGRSVVTVAGADIRTAVDDGNVIDGGVGDDYIAAGAGADVVRGGDGNDRITGMHGGDQLFGDAGDDIVYGDGVQGDYVEYTALESHGADVLVGGSGDDRLVGQGGGDALYGGDDDDLLLGDELAVSEQIDDTPAALHGNDVLDGGDGNDELQGHGRDDLLLGGAGNDRLFGDAPENLLAAEYHGSDRLEGEAGNDYLQGDGGDDVLLGGEDDDLLHGDATEEVLSGQYHGRDLLDGGDGDDSLWGGGSDDMLVGGGGADQLQGDNLESALAGQYHGSDVLDGGTGDDRLWGGGGADVLDGGEGDDFLDGDGTQVNLAGQHHGSDVLDGGAGNDALWGGGRDDVLQGGEGADALHGDNLESALTGQYHGNDVLDGGAGNDGLWGDGGSDQLSGGDGDDQLLGDDTVQALAAAHHGADLLDGGAGNDRMWGGGGGDMLFGGEGDDWLAGEDEESTVAVSTLSGDDTLDGGEGNDTLVGGNGTDLLTGGAGNDMLAGGSGDDTLTGGAGADLMLGGTGDDTFVLDLATESGDGVLMDRVDTGGGSDHLVLTGVSPDQLQVQRASDGSLVFALDPLHAVAVAGGLASSLATVTVGPQTLTFEQLVGERLQGGGNASTTSDGGRLMGGASVDALTVAHARTRVSGGRGNDTIRLNSGAGSTVVLRSGDGLDQVVAVRRNPAADGAPAPRNVLELGPGMNAGMLQLYQLSARSFVLAVNDQGDGVQFDAGDGSGTPIAPADWPFDAVRLADGAELAWQQVLDRGIARLPQATAGDDVLVLSPLNDTMAGLAGNDTIDGLAGNDVLSGGAGDDTLSGGTGDDALEGGDGNDLLVGGTGNDTLRGGGGTNRLLGGDGDDQLIGGDAAADDTSEGGEGNDQYFFRFSRQLTTAGHAIDSSLTSDDVYTVRHAGSSVDSTPGPAWTITDHGGNDALRLDSSFVTPANTTVRFTGTGFSIHSWNLVVNLEGMINAQGVIDPARRIESVVFQDGTAWTADQLRLLSQRTTAGNDVVQGFDSDDVIDGGAGGDILRGGGGNDTLSGGEGADKLWGEAGDDILSAGPDSTRGTSVLNGGLGRDTYIVRSGEGTVELGGDADADNAGIDTLRLEALRSELSFSLLRGATPADLDQLRIQWPGNSTTVLIKAFSDADALSVDRIEFADGSSVPFGDIVAGLAVQATAFDDQLHGTSLSETIDGGAGNDYIDGHAGDDTILGGSGADWLRGGSGRDILDGGADNDRYSLLDADTVLFGAGGGHDTVELLDGADAAVTNTIRIDPSVAAQDLRFRWVPLGSPGQENYTFSFSATVSATGDSVTVAYDRMLFAGQIRFQYGSGAVLDWQSLVTQANLATEQNDVLHDALGLQYLAGQGGDDLLVGADGNDTLEGGAGNDRLNGGDGDDVLNGGQGNDELRGGAGVTTVRYNLGDGKDTIFNPFRVDFSTIVEFGAGISSQQVRVVRPRWEAGAAEPPRIAITIDGGSAIEFADIRQPGELPSELRFADGTVWNRERLAPALLSPTSGDDELIGYAESDDVIDGGGGNDTLYGNGGSDTLMGGDGSDTLYANLRPNSPSDTVPAVDVLVGGKGDDVLYGTFRAADETRFHFDAGFGHDVVRILGSHLTVSFGPGITPDDILITHAPGYELVLAARTGAGSVRFESLSAVAAVHDDLRYVEFADGTRWDWTFIRSQLDRTPTEFDDTLRGGAGNDVISGLGGNDSISGGAGDDRLIGGAGRNFLVGGAGLDTFVVDGSGGEDIVADLEASEFIEFSVPIAGGAVTVWQDTGGTLMASHDASGSTIQLSGSGSFTNDSGRGFRFSDGAFWDLAAIRSRIAGYVVDGSATADVLTAVAGSSNWLRGREGNDTLTGGALNDRLDGGAGRDAMTGGAGNDTYFVDDAQDRVTEAAAGGLDTVRSSISYTLGAEVEQLVLLGSAAINGTGNGLNNTLTGNGAANTLDGGTGDDTMSGGAGNDTYVVNAATDTVVELAGQGIDTVRAAASYALGANVENLTLTGSGSIAATGNELNNILIGNSGANTLTGGAGNDTLDGGSGTDTMLGGAGNDTYVVERTADVTTEGADGGTDTVLSSVTRPLGDNLENLTLTGSTSINGTGNALSNVLVGNTANNTLSGLAGNDTYDGGAGTDVLTDNSTTSAEVYRFGLGYGTDTITDSGGTDRVELGAGITQSQLVFARNGNNLELTISGQADKLIVANWYTATANRIEEFRLADGSVVSLGLIPATAQASIAAATAGMVAQDPPEGGAWFQHWQRGWLGGWASHVQSAAPILPAMHGLPPSLDQRVQALVSAMAAFDVPVGSSDPFLPMAERSHPQWAVAAM